MGFEKKEMQDIINDIIVSVITNTSKINDINPGSIIRTLIEAMALQDFEQYLQLENIYNGTRISTATGEDLENLGELVGVVRNEGALARGLVTFIRTGSSFVDFVIPNSSVVSTQLNVENVYQFRTLVDKTFVSNIPAETFDFAEGVWRYKLSERLIAAIIDLQGVKGGVAHTFAYGTEYIVNQLFSGYVVNDVSTITVLDDCNATTDWSAFADSIPVTTEGTIKVEGTNSLKLGKIGSMFDFMQYEKELPMAVSVENKKVFINLYFIDQATINKFTSFTLTIGSDAGFKTSHLCSRMIVKDLLVPGWNEIVMDYTDNTNSFIVGNFNPLNVEWVRLNGQMFAVTGVSTGSILMDFIYAADADMYAGDIIAFPTYANYPDDATTLSLNWRPASVDILCEALEVGEGYNVAKDTIQYKISNLPNIFSVNNFVGMTDGVDIETDEQLRTRIQENAAAPGKSTVNAIRNELLAITGVASVTVNDLPLKDTTAEPKIFDSGVDIYKLDNEVAFVDDPTAPSNILISNTVGGGADYIYNTDYRLTSDSEIEWISTGSSPAHGNSFYVTYQSNWLGHVDVLVAGNVYPIGIDLSDKITDTINDVKAAGVTVNWAEPTVLLVNITCTVTVNTAGGFEETQTKESVRIAIINWLSNLEIGYGLYLSEFYKTVMNVPGVSNVILTNWNGFTVPPFTDFLILPANILKPQTSLIFVN